MELFSVELKVEHIYSIYFEHKEIPGELGLNLIVRVDISSKLHFDAIVEKPRNWRLLSLE